MKVPLTLYFLIGIINLSFVNSFSFKLQSHDSRNSKPLKLSQGEEDALMLSDSIESMLDTLSPCVAAQAVDDEELSSIYGKLCEISPPPSCFRNMLSSILPTCEMLSTEERVNHAIRLTLCELSAAQVQPPRYCRFDHTFQQEASQYERQECLRELKDSPQYWTSFSGNFRAIASICLAERKNHEKDEVIRLHRNITEIQLHALEILRGRVTAIDLEDKNISEKMASWDIMIQDIESSIIALSHKLSAFSSSSIADIEKQQNKMTQIMNHNIEQVGELSRQSESIMINMQDESRAIFHLTSDVQTVMDSSLSIANKLTLQMLEFMESASEKFSYFENHADGMAVKLSNINNGTVELVNQQNAMEVVLRNEQGMLESMIQDHTMLVRQLRESHVIASDMALVVDSLIATVQQNLQNISDHSENTTKTIMESFDIVRNTFDNFVDTVQNAETNFLGLRSFINSSHLSITLVLLYIFTMNQNLFKYTILIGAIYWLLLSYLSKVELFNLQYFILIPSGIVKNSFMLKSPSIIVTGCFILMFFTYVVFWIQTRKHKQRRVLSPRLSLSPSNTTTSTLPYHLEEVCAKYDD
ncbi:Tht1-like nuclear fusion protein-domain-containing protein [Dipodascopsis uninucleata]